MTTPDRGTILYDAGCPMCRDMMRRFEKTFAARGFAFAPLQAGLNPGGRPTEMRVRTIEGREFGGADALLFLAKHVWWAQPLCWIVRLPGSKRMLHRIYREVAARRSCDNGACLLAEVRR